MNEFDTMCEDLISIWFDFMDANRTALDPSVSTVDRHQAALYCECLMDSRYKLIAEIDAVFEKDLINV